ncbi:MAG: S8 family peptidase [Patescibacteria group bacterium]|jgi:subtilisin family serine protease
MISKKYTKYNLIIILIAVTIVVWPGKSLATTPQHILVRFNDSSFGIVKVNKRSSLDAQINEIKQNKTVRNVALNYERTIQEIIPNDASWLEQYSINETAAASIDVSQAWTVTKGSKKVRIAIIDTGVDLDHPDLAKKIWINKDEIAANGQDDDKNGYIDDVNGWNFIEDNNNPNPVPNTSGKNDGLSHGTHVAGIAAAKTNNTVGIAGVAWKAKIMPIRISDSSGVMTDADVAEGIQYAIDNGAAVINLSLGGLGYSSVLDDVIQTALNKGIVVVAAAGNNHRNMNLLPFYPVCSAGVIGVSAINENNHIEAYSNYGTNCVDIAAPGDNIISTAYNGDYEEYSGTSMATPVIAGIAALLKAQENAVTPTEVTAALKDSAVDIDIPAVYGVGRASAVGALLQLDSVKAVQVTGYNNSEKTEKLANNTVYPYKKPYFTWVVPKLLNKDIAGYNVYFGKQADADPITHGTWQTNNTLTTDKLPNTNSKTYYLKIAVKKNSGEWYSKQGTFTYILATK